MIFQQLSNVPVAGGDDMFIPVLPSPQAGHMILGQIDDATEKSERMPEDDESMVITFNIGSPQQYLTVPPPMLPTFALHSISEVLTALQMFSNERDENDEPYLIVSVPPLIGCAQDGQVAVIYGLQFGPSWQRGWRPKGLDPLPEPETEAKAEEPVKAEPETKH